METIRALVITGFGINCEEELAAAYRLSGATATIVHLNDILRKGLSIHDFDVVNFPGGFSFGDDIASGRVLANKIRFSKLPNGKSLLEELIVFIEAGKLIVGICNGFQVLVKLGLLPNVGGNWEQEVTLVQNNSAKYENRWCRLKVNPATNLEFLTQQDVIEVPVRHGEGKLLFGDDTIRKAVLSQGLNCLTYCDEEGKETDQYPQNPNGSSESCAGLSDTSGHVFGLMPHPEAFLSLYNHPNWGRLRRENPSLSEDGEGLLVFKNLIEQLVRKRELIQNG